MTHQHAIKLQCKQPPVVELDSQALAAYVRLSQKPVARTHAVIEGEIIVTVDLDSDGEAVGIELVGVTEFGIRALLKQAGVGSIPPELADRAKYVPAHMPEACSTASGA